MSEATISVAGPRLTRELVSALTRRALSDSRRRTVTFAVLFALYGYIQPVGYRHTYPTLADRISFARAFAHNNAVVLFYGKAYDILTVGGYTAWRVGGTLAIVAAVAGILAAVRALRAEEDSGHAELVLAGVVSRRLNFASALTGVAIGVAVLWLAETIGLSLGGLPVAGSAYLALATATVLVVFAAAGVLLCQLASTRRLATETGIALVGLAWLARIAADTSRAVGWLRWATPLGWAEELRPFTGPRPAVLLLPLASTILLLTLAARIAWRRDIGTGLFAAHDNPPPRLTLLSSPTGLALRRERISLIFWIVGTGGYGLVMGAVSKSVGTAGISKQLNDKLSQLGTGSILTPAGYLSFAFILFVLVAALFACAQVAAMRHEEADEQLETLLALPVSRSRWFTGRLLLAVAGIVLVAVAASALTWLGAFSQGVDVSLPRLLEAGVNCLPVGLLFLGLAALAYGLVPRASTGIAYTLVGVAFLWNLTGALLGAPTWVLDLSPFRHVGLVPAQAFRPGSAVVMALIGCCTAVAAVVCFRRRDLTGA